MHLTERVVRAIPFVDGQKDYTDDELAGLTLRVGKRTKTFMLLIGSGASRRRTKLGQFPHCSLQDARKKARVLIGERQLVIDDATAIKFSIILSKFMKAYAEKNKASTVYETERLLSQHLTPHFEGDTLGDITKRRMVSILDNIEKVSVRRHFYTAAYTFFRWCRRYDLRNPLEGVEKPPKSPTRARLLTEAEFLKIWNASLAMGTYGLLYRCLLVSGQRLSQIAKLDSAYIDRDKRLITWPAALMKNNKEFILPYGDLLHSLLPQGEGLLFRGESGRAWDNWTDPHLELLKRAEIPHVTRHDARRFYSSTHSAIGTPPHIRELLLTHAFGSQVTQIYDRYTYLEEKRTAQAAYEARLQDILKAIP